MGLLLPRPCPECGANGVYLWSVSNVLRTFIGVVLAFLLADLVKLWFRCPKCDGRFKAQ